MAGQSLPMDTLLRAKSLAVWSSFLAALTVVQCDCPRDAMAQAQKCTSGLGIGPPGAGPSKFVELGQVERAISACREGEFTRVVSCLRTLTDRCTGNTDREHFLRMMVDVDKSSKSVDYFCNNIKVYEANAQCIKDSHEEQSNCTQEVKRNFKTKATSTVNIDVMITSSCRYYRVGLSCAKKVINFRCGRAAADIVGTILTGFEPPKCQQLVDDGYQIDVELEGGDNSASSAGRNFLLVLGAFYSAWLLRSFA